MIIKILPFRTGGVSILKQSCKSTFYLLGDDSYISAYQ